MSSVVDPGKIVNTALVSVFQRKLLEATIVLRHWSGMNSRSVTQFEGKAINDLILSPDVVIDEKATVEFLKQVIAL